MPNRLRTAGLISLGLALAGGLVLSWQALAGTPVLGCGEGGACQRVLQSRWSAVFGVPVGLLGASVYAFLLTLALGAGPRPAARAAAVLDLLSVAVLGAALWFTAVQAVVLRALCPWCAVTQVAASLGVILLWKSRKGGVPPQPGFPWGRVRVLTVTLPLLVIGIAALVQALSPEPERIVSAQAGGVLRSGGGGKLELHGGAVVLAPAELPWLGTGEPVAVLLTDYTCPYCRELHRDLERLLEDEEGKAVVLVPAHRSGEARQLHALLLTVWRADPAAYRRLAEGLVEETLAAEVPVVLDAVEEALGLGFETARRTHAAWVERVLRQGEALLAANDTRLEVSTLPQMVAGDRILAGLPSPATVSALLAGGAGAAGPDRKNGGVTPVTPGAVAGAPGAELPEASSRRGAETGDAAGGSGAEIRFVSDVVDLGEVVKGAKVPAQFRFRNTGSAPLTLTSLRLSCGCMSVAGWRQTVAPGQEGEFAVTFDSARFDGPVRKSLEVGSNAPGGPRRLLLRAQVWSPVRLSATGLSFWLGPDGHTVRPQQVRIEVTGNEPLRIRGASASSGYFVSELEAVEEGRVYLLTVSVPRPENGIRRGEIAVELGHPRLPRITLPVHANLRYTAGSGDGSR